jgi:hypothetical protein
MKMVKSLLLGSAAGLVAVAGAQAADLPVKAKPVEYVKVCSLYGAGYYYIPGTDICMKVGGYIRQEWSYNYGENLTTGPWAGNSGLSTRTQGARDTVWRTRAYANFDTRQQTAYGTLRTYLQIGVNGNNSFDFSSNRAFIQIAGFTVGLASSYFDHYSVAAIGYLVDDSSDTGDGGRAVFAYTAQLGNGLSATISLEEPESKRAGVYNTSLAATTVVGTGGGAVTRTLNGPGFGTTGTAQGINSQHKSDIPDIVANLRINQAWGSAQIMGALKQVAGGYYGTSGSGAQNNGHPGDKWGWAVGGGLRINMPMIAAGDYLAFQVAYAQGATRYVSNTKGNNGMPYQFSGGTSLGFGVNSDAVFSGANAAVGSGLELTTVWGIAGGYEHFWTPSLRTSIHGHYYEVSYNANANNMLCASMNANSSAGGVISSFANPALCNNNWSTWQIGSRTQWNVTRDFYMGFDVIYAKLNTASKGALVNVNATGAQPTGIRTLEDQDVIAARVRWHRDIAP